jgi:hypothetical protein
MLSSPVQNQWKSHSLLSLLVELFLDQVTTVIVQMLFPQLLAE